MSWLKKRTAAAMDETYLRVCREFEHEDNTPISPRERRYLVALAEVSEALAREFAERAAVESWRALEHTESGISNRAEAVREIYGKTIAAAIAEADKDGE